MQKYLSCLLLVVCGLAGCRSAEEDTLFRKRAASETGISFINEVPDDATFNILNFLYYYDGGGVAVGDVNNDGLQDLYFTSNLGSNRLYLNKGNFRFEDITERAGVAGTGNWKTGVTMADVNGDGYVDIYVSVVDGYLDRKGRNQLFINDGDGTFTERAAEYGLDIAAYGTHAAFFDYDGDGDLDVYILNHSVHGVDTHRDAGIRTVRDPRSGDRLLRNDGGRFVDVSEEAGIYGSVVGYGLSVMVSDLNTDGCPDIYVANDFHENDYLYLNNCDGTFREVIREAMPHTSYSSMGADAADINNDGRPDLAVLDMLPEREDVLKTADEGDTYDLYDFKRRLGYHHQLSRNVLQLNQGHGRFSDIALLAGVEATDWSWAALFADFDHDGYNDLFVTNGIYRRPNDLDFIEYRNNQEVVAAMNKRSGPDVLALLQKMPQVPVPNYAFRNNGDLTFTNQAAAWGLDDMAFASGAAYVDLDNDGDLDLVVNNINAPASIFENRAETREDRHYLTVQLKGSGSNTAGIGTKLYLKHDGKVLFREQMPARGFQSSVDPRIHFGLGAVDLIDTLIVVWNDHRYQILTGVPANQTITLDQEEASGTFAYPSDASPAPLFADVSDALGIAYRHVENTYFDFNREPLMPHLLSREGPALAIGDVNGDGLDDLYVGGARKAPGSLLIQRPDGSFSPSNETLWAADTLYEDVDAAFFDADGDGDLDLFIVSGGNEAVGNAEALRSRLYRNDGSGRFTRDLDALPDFFVNGSVVAPADFDGDGDVDLFVGGRVVPSRYGDTPRSFLLENDGRGVFRDVTLARSKELAQAGMVTDAVWADYNGDGRLDLILVGEWMPVTIFEQQDGFFTSRTEQAGLGQTSGWWNSLLAHDMDGDGDVDLIAGNLGLNARPKATPEQPARLFVKDFDRNGTLDPIFTYYKGGVSYPMATRDQLIRQIQPLGLKLISYADYGASRVEDLFSANLLEDATVHEAHTFATAYLENQGDGTFQVHALPLQAQFAPVYAILAGDFDGDGHEDLLLAGNFSGVTPTEGRYDASYGLLLRGDGKGGFDPVQPVESNLYLTGEIRHLGVLRRKNGERLIVAARNDDSLQIVRPLRLPSGTPAP